MVENVFNFLILSDIKNISNVVYFYAVDENPASEIKKEIEKKSKRFEVMYKHLKQKSIRTKKKLTKML